MEDEWDLSEEECARLEKEAWLQVQKNRVGPALQPTHVVASESKADCERIGQPFVVNVFSLSNDRIATKSAYHEGLKNALKAVEGSSWDKEHRCWVFPSASLQRVVQVVRFYPGLNTQVQLSPDLSLSQGMLEGASLLPCRYREEPKENKPWPEPDSRQEEPGLLAACLAGPCAGLSPAAASCARDTSQGQAASWAQPSQPSDSSRTFNLSNFRVVKFQPCPNGRVSVIFRHHQVLGEALQELAFVQKIQGARKSGEDCWAVKYEDLGSLKSFFNSLPSVKVQVVDLQPMQHRALQEFSKLTDDSGNFSKLSPTLQEALMPFQREGILFGLQRGGRILCADEMGLGKTLQALGLAACYREDWPVLVIVPSALRLHWALSVCKWLHLPPFEVTVLVASSSSCTSRDGFDFKRCSKDSTVELTGQFNIVSYDLVDRVANKFQVVIADESHYLKNHKAKRTSLCCPRLQKARRAILLTGTPALARPVDLFKQLEALQPRAYKSLKEYGERYCQGSFFGQFNGSSNLEELHTLLSSTVMIRRLKKDVLPQLPPKRRQKFELMLSDKAMVPVKKTLKQLQEVHKVLRTSIDPEAEDAIVAKLKERFLISQLYHETAEAKVEAVKEYLSTLLETEAKFLVFGHHLLMLDALEKLVKDESKRKLKYIRIDGSTPHDRRQMLVEQFQTDKDTTVAILGIQAAGVGLTLTEASTVIFAELAWNPGDLVQAEDRAHRIGQENAVNVYYLHARDTVDDMIWAAVERKLDNLGKTLDGQERASWSMEKVDHGTAEGKGHGPGGAGNGQQKLGFPLLPKPQHAISEATEQMPPSAAPRSSPHRHTSDPSLVGFPQQPGALEQLGATSSERSSHQHALEFPEQQRTVEPLQSAPAGPSGYQHPAHFPEHPPGTPSEHSDFQRAPGYREQGISAKLQASSSPSSHQRFGGFPQQVFPGQMHGPSPAQAGYQHPTGRPQQQGTSAQLEAPSLRTSGCRHPGGFLQKQLQEATTQLQAASSCKDAMTAEEGLALEGRREKPAACGPSEGNQPSPSGSSYDPLHLVPQAPVQGISGGRSRCSRIDHALPLQGRKTSSQTPDIPATCQETAGSNLQLLAASGQTLVPCSSSRGLNSTSCLQQRQGFCQPQPTPQDFAASEEPTCERVPESKQPQDTDYLAWGECKRRRNNLKSC